MNMDKLPVEIKENLLPKENGKKYKMEYDYRVRTSGGIVDVIFLAGIMVTCALWAFVLGLALR